MRRERAGFTGLRQRQEIEPLRERPVEGRALDVLETGGEAVLGAREEEVVVPEIAESDHRERERDRREGRRQEDPAPRGAVAHSSFPPSARRISSKRITIDALESRRSLRT